MAFFFGWLMVMSFVLLKMRQHYTLLTTRTHRKSIDEILEEVLKQIDITAKKQDDLQKKLEQVQLHLKKSLQKIGLTRFNAFSKTEGDKQSFVLAFLNDQNDGVVVNFIYIPDGIRVYAKPVKGGAGEGHALSEEEKEAVEQAI